MSETSGGIPEAEWAAHSVRVLLVDDQAMIGEAVRRMLASEPDLVFQYCGDPTQAFATAQAFAPTIILLDLVMPEIDGLTMLKFLRANPATREIPVVVLSTKEDPKVKAESFSLGASDYLVKLPDRIELVARIRHHSQGYINLLQRNEAYRALLESQKKLAAELAEAAAYVQSLLPAPMTGPIRTEWQFVPSDQLGGDAFGYHWIDEEHLGLFLLDVCGHGVGAALLSISVMNVLRSQSLSNVDFRDPPVILGALNEAFPMESHNNMYFTLWYGVYHQPSRVLRYAGGGHPPALLFTRAGAGGAWTVRPLESRGLVVGGMSGVTYRGESCTVPPGAILFLTSDGTYEISHPDGGMWTFEGFTEFLGAALAEGRPELSGLVEHVRKLRGATTLDDDFSIVKVVFDEP